MSAVPEPAPSSAPSSAPSTVRRVLPKLLISLLLAGLFVFLVQRGGVPLLPPAEAFTRVSGWGVAGYVLTLLGMHFFRASRWRFLMRPVKRDIPFWDGVLLNWIGFFAIFVLPLRLGEFARPALTKLRHGVSLSAGLGTVAVERVIDGLVTSLCVVWALYALPHREAQDTLTRSLPYYGNLAAGLFFCAFLGLVLFLWQRELAVKLVYGTIGRVSPRLGDKLASKVDSVADGVRSIAHPRLGLGFLVETLLYWGLNAGGMWVLGRACGLDMTFGHAVAVMGVLAIGILLPAGPGLFGSFQLAVSTGLKLYFAAELVGSQGAVYVFLLYGLQAILLTLTGILPLYAMKLSFADILRPAPSEDGPFR
ncbi:MAG: flippase-like domain-containing protein [Sandaracinaceae bacterium]|nr:flippase-like domain-containing protein [Sandaracinaceae bacterium]